MISVLIHTRNEERMLPDCLASVCWADEIIVADMHSADSTCVIAEKAGARIIQVPIVECVDEVRNQAISQCNGDWILVLDADERIPQALALRLRDISKSNTDVSGYSLPRRNYFLGVWIKHGWWPDSQVRFFRKGKASWSGAVHDLAIIKGIALNLPSNENESIEHVAVTNLSVYLEKCCRYAKLDAYRLKASLNPLIWPWILRRPLGEFYGRYFREQAWRHGMHGLAWSLIMACYQLQVALNYWALDVQKHKVHSQKKLKHSVRWEAIRANWKWLRP